MTNNVSILHDFFDITNFTVYVTAHRGPNFSLSFTVGIKEHRYFPIHVYTQCS